MALFSEIKDIVGGRLFTKDAKDVDLNSAESIKEEISRLKDILDDTATGAQAFQIDKKIKDLEDKLKQLTKDADFENIFQGIMRFAGLDAAKFSAEEAKDIGERAGVDFGEVDFNEFRLGLEVEMEHADLTDGDPGMTAKIALAHLKEIPDYYTRLTKMENEAKTEDEESARQNQDATTDGGPGSGIKGHKTYHAEEQHKKQTTGQGSIAKYAHLKNPGAAMSRVRRKLEGLYGKGVAPNFHAEVTSLRKKYPGAKFSQNLLAEMVSQGFKAKEGSSVLSIETPYGNYRVKKASKDGGPGSGIKGHVTNRQKLMAQRKNLELQKKMNAVKSSGGILEHEDLYIVRPVLAAIKRGKDPTKAFAEAAENENYHGDRPDIKQDRRRIAAYLGKKHGVKIDNDEVDKMI